MKRFLIRLLIFFPVPLLVGGLNYYEDPAHFFGNGSYETGIANYLSKGKHVTDVLNYNERLLQKLFIEKMSKCPQTIVLGSSRIMQISRKEDTRHTFINNGVSGATIEDLLAIYYLYEKKNCAIDTILIGMEPWMLNDNHEQVRWKTLGKEYQDFCKKLNLPADFSISYPEINPAGYVTQLFSLSYFKSSVDYLVKNKNVDYKATNIIANAGFTRLADGSIFYGEDFRNVDQKTVRKRVNDIVNGKPIYSLGNFSSLSKKYKTSLVAFIQYLHKKNISVRFIFAPYHPAIFDRLRKDKNYRMVFEAENYYRSLAGKFNIPVSGSYDPVKLGLSDTSFYDGLHCKRNAIEKIIK